jgi:hypothetical protein
MLTGWRASRTSIAEQDRWSSICCNASRSCRLDIRSNRDFRRSSDGSCGSSMVGKPKVSIRARRSRIVTLDAPERCRYTSRNDARKRNESAPNGRGPVPRGGRRSARSHSDSVRGGSGQWRQPTVAAADKQRRLRTKSAAGIGAPPPPWRPPEADRRCKPTATCWRR